jgi:hypothetical protein
MTVGQPSPRVVQLECESEIAVSGKGSDITTRRVGSGEARIGRV